MVEPAGDLKFNAFTGAWLPLLQKDSTTVWASPIQVLCGEKDGADLDYPRDDFRVYARLLLSALTQALFPARDKAELQLRLASPLVRGTVEARLGPVLEAFDLFGPTPFLQIMPPADAPTSNGAAPFVFGRPDLYPPRVEVEAVSLPIALVTLFAEQTYAGGAGRGYGPGPGGQPGAFTLIDEGTVRGSAWANTLTLEKVKERYTPDPGDAWSNVVRAAKPRAACGLLEGLFFQPRGVWLIRAGEGTCSFTGRRGQLVRLSPFLPKSELTRRPVNGEDVWVHPCAPMVVNSQGIAAVRLNAERPPWTGLAQLLSPVSGKKAEVAHPLQGPAQVLSQWKDVKDRVGALRLIVLDFVRDKANIKRRFFESLPVSSDLVGGHELTDVLRALVGKTRKVASALEEALVAAHDDRRIGGLALAEARTAFWRATEVPFMEWWENIVEVESDPGRTEARNSCALLMTSFRKLALSIFDDHADMSEFDPRKQARVTLARRELKRALWQPPPSPAPTQNQGGAPVRETPAATFSADLCSELRRVRARYEALPRSDIAALRRCQTADEVAIEGPYWRIAASLAGREVNLPHVVLHFSVAPQRSKERFSFGALLRQQLGDSDGAALRFRRLLDSRDWNVLDHRLHGLLRLASRTGVSVDWGVLGSDILWFFAESGSVRRRWAQDFYAAAGPGQAHPSTADYLPS